MNIDILFLNLKLSYLKYAIAKNYVDWYSKIIIYMIWSTWNSAFFADCFADSFFKCLFLNNQQSITHTHTYMYQYISSK